MRLFNQQVSARVVKVPREFMRAALQRAVHELLDQAVAAGVSAQLVICMIAVHTAYLSSNCG